MSSSYKIATASTKSISLSLKNNNEQGTFIAAKLKLRCL